MAGGMTALFIHDTPCAIPSTGGKACQPRARWHPEAVWGWAAGRELQCFRDARGRGHQERRVP